MFTPEDFEIPLEKQLRMRIVLDEIDGCNDVDVLKGHLKACTESSFVSKFDSDFLS